MNGQRGASGAPARAVARACEDASVAAWAHVRAAAKRMRARWTARPVQTSLQSGLRGATTLPAQLCVAKGNRRGCAHVKVGLWHGWVGAVLAVILISSKTLFLARGLRGQLRGDWEHRGL